MKYKFSGWVLGLLVVIGVMMVTQPGWATPYGAKAVEAQKQVIFSGQIAVADVAKYAAQGVKSIVDARPDSELSAGEATSQAINQAADTYGMKFLYDPVYPNKMTMDEVKKFAAFYNKSPRPILIYCRSGKRAQQLYDAAKNQGLID